MLKPPGSPWTFSHARSRRSARPGGISHRLEYPNSQAHAYLGGCQVWCPLREPRRFKHARAICPVLWLAPPARLFTHDGGACHAQCLQLSSQHSSVAAKLGAEGKVRLNLPCCSSQVPCALEVPNEAELLP